MTMSTAAALVQGGDDRIAVPVDRRMNKYNVTNVPVKGVSRGSCTSSIPSERSFALGQATLARIRNGETEDLANDLRQALREAWQLKADTSLTFFPSGTDAEFLLALLALGRAIDVAGEGARVLNVVPCAGEVGSGTARACAGLHFSSTLPSGAAAKAGEKVFSKLDSGSLCSCSMKSVEVKLRNTKGEARSGPEIDAEVEQLVSEALSTGQADVCAVHLVAGCKTGHVAVSFALMQRLRKKFGSAVLPLLDACQGRLVDGAPRDFVDAGYGVLLTGSKFYGGPPFSGVAILNGELTKELRSCLSKPLLSSIVMNSSLRDYVSFPLLDPSLQPCFECLRTCEGSEGSWNITCGVLLRWAMATYHIQEFHNIPETRREALLSAWISAVEELFADPESLSPALEMLKEDRLPGAEDAGIFSANTIVSMRCQVKSQGKWRYATLDELKHVHCLMAVNLRDQIPKQHRDQMDLKAQEVLAQRCFIGQPVVLAEGTSPVLRVALGAVQVAEANALVTAEQGAGEENNAVAIEWPSTLEDAVVLRKMASILSDWDVWCDMKNVVPSPADKVKCELKNWDEQSRGTLTVQQLNHLLKTLGAQCLAPEATDRLFRELLGTQDCGAVEDMLVHYEDVAEYLNAPLPLIPVKA